MDDKKLRIYGQLTISSISFACFYLSSVLEESISLWKLLIYINVTTFIVWESLRLGILLARRMYPQIQQTKQRLVCVAIITLVIVAIFPYVKFGFGDLLQLYGPGQPAGGPIPLYAFLRIVGQNIFFCLFIAAVYEAIYFFELWKQMFRQSEALKQEHLVSQVHSLKEQVSPHFLFNSLNTLSYLVSRDATKAERYIEEMAAVYRYLLTINERHVVTLEEELSFIKAYTHLLKTRYNQHFHVTVDVDPIYHSWLLPPLTLQLLIENAVKHNIVDSQHPMEVTIRSLENEAALEVQNPIQKKRKPVRSERKGLTNIIARYELLGLPAVRVEETDHYFTVVVPFKPSPVYESADY